MTTTSTRAERRRVIETLVIEWTIKQREERGDAFATEAELRSIHSDPLAWLELLKGEDAFALLAHFVA